MQRKLASGARRLAATAALASAVVASAQAPHPIPPLQRPLHERARGAEIVAVGVVAGVERGRIAIEGAVVVRGTAASRFALKRSPLRPPPLAAGERALLFLSGARPPYVFAGDANDVVPIASVAEARALAAALPELLAAGEDVAALRAVYARWASGASPLLRDLGHAGLEALPAPDRPERTPRV
jgi:hypothetical protein